MSDLCFLNVESLKLLDGGKAAVGFEQAIARAVEDCLDRPTDDRPRKVTMTLHLVPVPVVEPETAARCDSCHGTFVIGSRFPDRQTQQYDFGIRKSGNSSQLVFSQMSARNHRQGVMFGAENDVEPTEGTRD